MYRDSFEVKQSSLGPQVGRGVFATVDIPKGAYFMPEMAKNSIKFDIQAVGAISEVGDALKEKFEETFTSDAAMKVDSITHFMDGYGYDSLIYGDLANFVDSGISTFVNHGCNGTSNLGARRYLVDKMYNDVYNYGEDPTLTDQEADPERPVEEYGILQGDESVSVFKPGLVRRTELKVSSSDAMLKDVKAGEEIFTNYVLIPQVRPARKYSISPWYMIHLPWEIAQ
jgi:hypothetical protein